MQRSVFAEDVFLKFYKLVQSGQLTVQHQDFSPILSFHTKIYDQNPLTKNQANYIIKLLEKYKNLSASLGIDYRDDLSDLKWKQPFRVLDLEKRIYVEKGKSGQLEICLKFPYQLKKEFEDEIFVNLPQSQRVSHWDQDEKVRRLRFYDFNLITLYEFALKHQFDIDDSFMNVLADVEEIWQNPEEIVPYSTIEENCVELHNASAETRVWWFGHKKWEPVNDLLLAKSIGFHLQKNPQNLVEKIASSQTNTFWIKSNEEFFYLGSQVSGKICIILDRSSDTLRWLQEFVADADKNSVNRHEIKVCFRDTKENKTGLNNWVKATGVGGTVETGKYLIFESKPAKWLFKSEQDVKILVTNNIYPPTNLLARDWFNSHPCVIYLGPTKPTGQRGQKIVNL